MNAIHNDSDIGITCTHCGALFTGQARYHTEIQQMFIDHWLQIHHDIIVGSEPPTDEMIETLKRGLV